jgi:hypothetical protein
MKLAYVAITVLALLSAGACTRNPHECAQTTLHNDDPQLWTVVFSSCGDKKKYGITCAPDTTLAVPGIFACTCTVDGVSEKTFSLTGALIDDPGTLKIGANAQCGWTIE